MLLSSGKLSDFYNNVTSFRALCLPRSVFRTILCKPFPIRSIPRHLLMKILDVNTCIPGWPAHVPAVQRTELGEFPSFRTAPQPRSSPSLTAGCRSRSKAAARLPHAAPPGIAKCLMFGGEGTDDIRHTVYLKEIVHFHLLPFRLHIGNTYAFRASTGLSQ